MEPEAAARLLTERFARPLLLGPERASRLPALLAESGIAGGAVCDALVGLAAREHRAELATRDGRARATYEAIGARVMVVA